MPRLPFDPEKVAAPAKEQPARRERQRYGGFDSAEPLSVTGLCQLVKRILADRAPAPIRVVGEISNFNDRNHWFFSLKDETNVVACAMFAPKARQCAFTPEHGQQVVATGRLDYYGPQGKLQLYVDELQPVGQGALELRLRQLCDQLRKLGYFDESHKKPLPLFPRRIAVLTSASGAAVHDVIRTARQRWPGIRLVLVDVRVQGAEAAPEIAEAIHALSQQHERLGVDAVLLTRGGGSLEDLWAFNERQVADAVYRCSIPTVAAIGHETDTTVAELVADLRCSTPTQAAARLVPDVESEHQRLEQYASRLTTALRRLSQHARQRLQALAEHPIFRRPGEALAQRRQTLQHLLHRLTSATRRRLAALRDRLHQRHRRLARIEPVGRVRLARHQLQTLHRRLRQTAQQRLSHQRDRLDALERELRAIGPENVLSRGYSYTTRRNGELVRSPDEVAPGDRIISHLSDGRIESDVVPEGEPEQGDGRGRGHGKTGDRAGNGSPAAQADQRKRSGRPAKRSAKGGRGTGGPGLFE